MKIVFFLLLVCMSCATTKNHLKKITIDDLSAKNQMYGVKNNPYFYFMIDSVGGKHLVKTHMFNSQKVIWTESLIRH